MAYDRTCPNTIQNSHLQAQVDSQESRGKGIQNVGGGDIMVEGKVGDMCGPTWGPCVAVLARLGGLCRGASGMQGWKWQVEPVLLEQRT